MPLFYFYFFLLVVFFLFFYFFLCLSFYLPLFYFIVSWRKLYGEVVCNESKSKGKAGYDFVLSVIPSGISLLIFRICLVLSLFQPPYSTFKIPNFPLPDCPSSPCHISIIIIIYFLSNSWQFISHFPFILLKSSSIHCYDLISFSLASDGLFFIPSMLLILLFLFHFPFYLFLSFTLNYLLVFLFFFLSNFLHPLFFIHLYRTLS